MSDSRWDTTPQREGCARVTFCPKNILDSAVGHGSGKVDRAKSKQAMVQKKRKKARSEKVI
jgi:hypothetical protein